MSGKKYLRLDYWGGHLKWVDDEDDGTYSMCILLDITDYWFSEFYDASYSGADLTKVRLRFRQANVSNGYMPAQVVLALEDNQKDSEMDIWIQEQIRNAFESDNAVYYPEEPAPVLIIGDDIDFS